MKKEIRELISNYWLAGFSPVEVCQLEKLPPTDVLPLFFDLRVQVAVLKQTSQRAD